MNNFHNNIDVPPSYLAANSYAQNTAQNLTDRFIKRSFDLLLSSMIIVFILSWLLPILALIIRLDSKGPVFFVQKRSGKNNIPFGCIKLRSLHCNPEADLIQVSKHDRRVTRVGKFLRRSNLDELPQFLNVLLGEMSVVGARPHMLKHTEEFARMDENYMARHLLKPGVTGWAQVNGHRGEIKHHEQLNKRVQHDIWYIANWKLALDIKIILLTISLTLKGDENAF